eukprot:4414121-Pyramimonas_sp.AAC.1
MRFRHERRHAREKLPDPEKSSRAIGIPLSDARRIASSRSWIRCWPRPRGPAAARPLPPAAAARAAGRPARTAPRC